VRKIKEKRKITIITKDLENTAPHLKTNGLKIINKMIETLVIGIVLVIEEDTTQRRNILINEVIIMTSGTITQIKMTGFKTKTDREGTKRKRRNEMGDMKIKSKGQDLVQMVTLVKTRLGKTMIDMTVKGMITRVNTTTKTHEKRKVEALQGLRQEQLLEAGMTMITVKLLED
jgi:hypothetical protein